MLLPLTTAGFHLAREPVSFLQGAEGTSPEAGSGLGPRSSHPRVLLVPYTRISLLVSSVGRGRPLNSGHLGPTRLLHEACPGPVRQERVPSWSRGADERRFVGRREVHSLPVSQALTSGWGAWGWGSRVREDVSGNDGSKNHPPPPIRMSTSDVFWKYEGFSHL